MTPSDALTHGSLIAILAMTAATIFMRAGGFWLMAYVPLTPRVRRMLEALPGAVVAALVLPIVVKNGLPAFLSAGTVVAAIAFRCNAFVALAIAVATAALARAFGF
ncbi:MAG: AzlD domain-containing protein [Rhizobiales bacterium]|nr:AzlD domain-containing protein [Hyphomicrobiales bacterium]